ncbi:HAD-IA family hydrolase [Candidatus Dojkabacteria bacterium]|nr:HAD-IA family hydrolase [Candidatus Dojkabacteria bacterium]
METNSGAKNFILFDFDDTLVDTFNIKAKAIQSTAKKYYDLPLSIGQIRNAWGTPFKKMFQTLFGDVDSIEKIIDNYFQQDKLFPSQALPGVFRTIKKLAEDNYLGIISSSDSKAIKEDLRAANIPIELFGYLQAADQSEYHKPDPRVFDTFLNHLQDNRLKVNKTYYIGDSRNDYLAAKNTDVAFIGVRTGLDQGKYFLENKVISVGKFSDILDQID